MADDYAAFADYYANLDTANDEGMSLTDPIKNIGAETANIAGSAATAGQLAAEKSNMPNAAKIMRGISMGLHDVGDYAESGISEAGKKARDAALIPQEGQEQLGSHPLRELVMKASGAVPYIAGVGGAGAAAGPVGAAGAGGGLQYIQDLDKAIAWTNKISDEELAKAAPVFDQKKLELYKENISQGMDEKEAEQKASSDARTYLHKGLYTGGQALVSGIVGAAAGAAGEQVLKGSSLGEGLANYILTGNTVRSTAIPLTAKQIIGKEAIEGTASAIPLGAAGAGSDYSQQQSENFAQGKEGTDLGRSLTAFLNGTAEGYGFHFGMRAAQKGPGKVADYLSGPAAEPPRDISSAFNQGSAAPGTGATPKGTRASTQPPPNEAAQEGQIGNTVNPPTRDGGVGPAGEEIRAKSKRGRKKAEVPVVDEKAPDAAETAALAASTPGASDVTTLAEPKPPVDLSAVQVPAPREAGPEPLQRQEIPDVVIQDNRTTAEAPVTPEAANKGMVAATNRQEYVDAVGTLGETAQVGERFYDPETDITWTVSKRSTNTGAEIVEFQPNVGDGKGAFSFTRYPDRPDKQAWKLSGEIGFGNKVERVKSDQAPVTPTSNDISPATETPEAGPTIEAQLADLNNKKRSVMRFNNEGQVPDERPKGVYQHKASDGSVWWYRTGKGGTSKEKIETAVKGKTENELLGLGPFNKEQVAADVASGAEPTAVVARTPEGVEKAAAATTDRLAPETLDAVKAANPDATVSVEQPEAVIAGRENGTGKVQPTGRILDATTPEQRAAAEQAQAELDAKRADEAKKAAQREKALTEKEPIVQGERSSKDKKRVEAAAENAAKAQKIFADHQPGEAESGLVQQQAEAKATAKIAILDRARAVLKAAEEAGYKIPGSIRNHTPAEAFIYNAKKLLEKYGNSKAFARVADKPFNEFIKSEKLQRGSAEDFKADLSTRRAEGDEKFQKKTSDFEKGKGEAVAEEPTGKVDVGVDNETVQNMVERAETATQAAYRRGKEAAAKREMERRAAEALPPEEGGVVGQNKAGTFKAETVKRRTVTPPGKGKSKVEEVKAKKAKPETRKAMLSDDELLAGMDPTEGRTTGEREGHVSLDYGSHVASIPISRTARTSDLLRKLEAPQHHLAGKLFPLIRMRLTHLVGDVKVHFVDAAELERVATDMDPKNKGILGFYKPKHAGEGGYIVMADSIAPERMSHVFTHEVLHAATEDALLVNPKFRAQIDAIMGEVKAIWSEAARAQGISLDRKPYGFTNASEFIAEAFSNPKFQEFLAAVRISDKLAKKLGLERRSLWSVLVDRIRETLRLPSGVHSALEALIKPTNELMILTGRMKDYERMDRTAAEVRPYIGQDLVERAREFSEDRGVNAKNLGRRFLRASASNTMLARMSAKLGPKFGAWARKANELHQQMAVRTGNLLDRKGGGLEIVREGDRLRRLDPAKMSEAMDLGWEITELNLDMSAGAKNEHIFGKGANSDILAATQAKEAYKDLRRRLDALPKDYREWLEKTAKFFREEDNSKRLAVIKRILKEAEVEEPGLAERILDGNMTAADEAKFKTNTIVKHLNEVAELKRLKGWYFPLERDGNFVLTAERQFVTPAGKHIERLKDADGNQTNELLVTDPHGRRRFAPSRRAAQAVMRELWTKDRLHAKAEPAYVLKSDGKTIVPKEEAEAIGAPDTFKAYKVIVQTEHLSMHSDEASRNRQAQQLQASGYRNISQSVRRDNPNAKWGGLVPSQMETIINSLQRRDKFKNLSDGAQNELVQSLRQATIKLLPGARIQHHNLQRRNIEGYSRDMINSIARNAQQSAAFQARTELQPEINRALQGMQDEITKDKYSYRTQQRQELKNELENRLAIGSDIKPPGAVEKGVNFVSKLSMIDKLVGPSFHIINAQEPWTTAAPVIGGRHGFVNAARMLKGAYNMIGARNALGAGLRDTKLAWSQESGFTDYRRTFQNEITKNISGERGKRINEMLDHLHDLNLFGHEAGMEVHRLAQPAETMIGRGVDRIDLMSRQVGQAIEAINRAVTGISAYELEYKKNGGNHQAAMRYAHDVVHDTMGNYSASNAAPIFNHPLGKAALQFKKFAQRTYFLLGKMVGDAARGDREALRSFAGVMFTHAVVAGALGLPLEPIKLALMASGALGGYSYDEFEGLVRDTAAQALGKTGGEIVTRGVPRGLLGIDTSGRQSLADLLTFGKPMSGKPNDLKSWLFDTLAGAPAGMLLKPIAAARSALEGDVAGVVDNAIPIKAVRDIGRAGFGLMGGKLDRTGRQMMEPYSAYEAGVQALGFTPGRKAEDYEERSRVNNESFHRKEERSGLINGWVNATPEGKAKAWRAVQEFNRTVPRDAQITMSQLQSQAKNRATEKIKGKYDRGMRIGKQNRDIYENAQRTY